jgi:hypothetical protein
MPNIDDEIRAQIEAFAENLTAMVRRAALDAVTAAIGGAPAAAQPAKRGRGRPRKDAGAAAAPAKAAKTPAAAKPAKGAPAAKAPVAKKAGAKRAPGEKRPPGELTKLVEKLYDFIKGHPGQRMEAIGKALATPTKDLNLPVKKLLSAKKIRVKGQKRATEYFAA